MEEEKIKSILIDELKRLNRMNDILEKKINIAEDDFIENEPERIISNVQAMCQITCSICNLKEKNLL